MTTPLEPTNLSLLDEFSPVSVFVSQEHASDILDKIETAVRSVITDPTTEQGRKEIISLAYKVSRTKTALDNAGKEMQAEAKAEVDRINAIRRLGRERLDVLGKDVRRPVTEMEEREELRISEHRGSLSSILVSDISAFTNLQQVETEQKRLEELSHRSWEEFSEQAELAITHKSNELEQKKNELILVAQEQEQKAAEEKKKAEEERIQREAQIAAEAERRARDDERRKLLQEKEEAERKASQIQAEKEREARKVECIRRVNRLALDAFKANGFSDDAAKKVITLIVSGEIPNISINYVDAV